MTDFYKECAIPKPGTTKKKKAYNGYKEKPNRFCHYCGTPAAERHEVFGGSNRELSIKMGFQVDLCPECHRAFHEQSTPEAKERVTYWRQKYQTEYEDKLIDSGISPDKAREMWISMIGRSYI